MHRLTRIALVGITLAVSAVFARAACTLVTLSGTAFDPSSTSYTSGTLTCELQMQGGSGSSGSCESSGVTVPVAGKVTATIGPTGAFSINLVPTVSITPAGTAYRCTFSLTNPRYTAQQTIQINSTSPSSIDWGDATRLDTGAGTVIAVAGGASGQAQYNNAGVFAGTAALTFPAGGNAMKSTARYTEQDLTGTGTWITRTLGDVDGDGTLSFAKDVRPVIVADQALPARCDLNGDGTNESMCIKYKWPAGVFKFGFRDTVTFAKGGNVLKGEGVGATFFVIAGACNGTADYDGDGTIDSLENGPTCVGGSVAGTACTSDATCTGGGTCEDQQDYRTTFMNNSSNFAIVDISLDGRSDQYLFSQLPTTDANYCDANDTDSDGSAVYPIGTDHCPCDPTRIAAPCTTYCNSNPATGSKAIGGACAQAGRTWCPNDEHFWFNSVLQSPVVENLIYTDNEFRRSDSNVWELNDPVKGLVISRNKIYGSGEQSVQVYSDSRITNNYFERCAGSGIECLTMSPVDYDIDGTYDTGDDLQNVLIVDNEFKDCVGACIRNVAKAGDMTVRNTKIEGNIIDNSVLGSSSLGVINFQAASTGTRTWDNLSIDKNIINAGSMPANVIQLAPAGGTTARFNNPKIDGNQITGTTPNTSGARSGIFLQYATGGSVSGNVMDLTADATVTGGNETQCAAVYDSVGIGVNLNECKIGGAGGAQGLNLAGLSDSVVSSNLFNFAGLTLTAGLETGITLQTSATTTTRLTLQGNYIRGGDMLMYLNPATNNMIGPGNYCYASAQCIYLNGGSTLANRVTGNTAYLTTGAPWFNNATAQRNLMDNNDCVDCGANAAYGGWENPTTSHGSAWVTDSDTNGTLDATSKLLFGGSTQICNEGTSFDGIQTCDAYTNPTSSSKTLTKPDRSGTYALYSTNALDLQKTDSPVACAAGTEGYIYYDDSLNEVCFCNGTNWVTVDGTGGTPSSGSCG